MSEGRKASVGYVSCINAFAGPSEWAWGCINRCVQVCFGTLLCLSSALATHSSCRSPTEKFSPFSVTSESNPWGNWLTCKWYKHVWPFKFSMKKQKRKTNNLFSWVSRESEANDVNLYTRLYIRTQKRPKIQDLTGVAQTLTPYPNLTLTQNLTITPNPNLTLMPKIKPNPNTIFYIIPTLIQP